MTSARAPSTSGARFFLSLGRWFLFLASCRWHLLDRFLRASLGPLDKSDARLPCDHCFTTVLPLFTTHLPRFYHNVPLIHRFTTVYHYVPPFYHYVHICYQKFVFNSRSITYPQLIVGHRKPAPTAEQAIARHAGARRRRLAPSAHHIVGHWPLIGNQLTTNCH